MKLSLLNTITNSKVSCFDLLPFDNESQKYLLALRVNHLTIGYGNPMRCSISSKKKIKKNKGSTWMQEELILKQKEEDNERRILQVS